MEDFSVAIYHLEMKLISRGEDARSSVAVAAYRSGLELQDDRYGIIHDYTAKSNVREHFIELARSDGSAPDDSPQGRLMEENLGNSGGLWNEVEAVETRKDARLAREVMVALPSDLTPEQQRELVLDFVHDSVNARGWIADVSIHEADRGGDQRNAHAHILIPDRQVGTNYQWEARKNRELNRREVVSKIRQEWGAVANRHLERAGVETRIDHRSLEDQGIDRPPNIHHGPALTHMLRSGDPEKVARAESIIAERQEYQDRSRGWVAGLRERAAQEFGSISRTQEIAAAAEHLAYSYIPNSGRPQEVERVTQAALDNWHRELKPFEEKARAQLLAERNAWDKEHGKELSKLQEQLPKERQRLKDDNAPWYRLRMEPWREEQREKIHGMQQRERQLLGGRPDPSDRDEIHKRAQEMANATRAGRLATDTAAQIYHNQDKLREEHPQESKERERAQRAERQRRERERQERAERQRKEQERQQQLQRERAIQQQQERQRRDKNRDRGGR
jgi:hypothetical protein